MIASRYGVPTDALLRVNGFASAQQVRPGARLVIPVYHSNAGRPATRVAKADRFETSKPSKASASGDKSARDEKTNRKSNVARVETKPAHGKSDVAKAVAEKEKSRSARAKLARAEETPGRTVEKPVKASAAETSSERAADLIKTDKVATASIPHQHDGKEASAVDSHPEFRWPARGRIIQAFSSGGNDGINISVPEGTQVKAAEGGVVAYAGNELKGYGNLVLIRHPNGFVTAYAHNGHLEVRRGDQVKRGQTIARSGQSGNVGSPQLHFELRKGSTPVNPTNYLAEL
jgi:murein DD-endopeptidase MepM/ murein hydrolase activator NlpD